MLIVGAGPTGLLLAAELRRRGVDCVLIDAHDQPQQWDRATIVHARTMELLASLGIADRFLEAGVHQWGIRIFSGGEQLAEMDLAGSGARYGFSLDVSEEVTEAILTDYLTAQGGEVSAAGSWSGSSSPRTASSPRSSATARPASRSRVSVLETLPERSTLTTRPDSWLMISRWLVSAPLSDFRLASAKTSEKSLVHLLDDDEAAAFGIVGEALKADVADRRA